MWQYTETNPWLNFLEAIERLIWKMSLLFGVYFIESGNLTDLWMVSLCIGIQICCILPKEKTINTGSNQCGYRKSMSFMGTKYVYY